jgi:hypothetical protein
MRILFTFFIIFILTACVGLPSNEEAALADYGVYPNNYEEIVKNYYYTALKDPDSARFKNISIPKKYWLGDRFTGAKFGYLVAVTINAKNSYGAYTGYETHALLLRNGNVIEYVNNCRWFEKMVC